MPIWDAEWAHTNVCIWDVAAAHLCAEKALDERGGNIGGEAFLVTGPGPAWKMQDARNALQVIRFGILLDSALICSCLALFKESFGIQVHLAATHLDHGTHRRGVPLPPILLLTTVLRSLWLSAENHAEMGWRTHLPATFHARVYARRGD